MPTMTAARKLEIMRQHRIDPLALLLGVTTGAGRPDPDDDGEPPIPPTAAAVLSTGTVGLGVAVMPDVRGLGLTSVGTTLVRKVNSVAQPRHPQTAGLKQPPPKPAQKINTTYADGSPIELPPLPPPPPQPTGARLSDPVDDWLSDNDLNEQLEAIATEATYLDRRLAELGEEREGEDHAVFAQRQRWTHRLARICERHRLLTRERSRRFDLHVDAVARDRAAGRR